MDIVLLFSEHKDFRIIEAGKNNYFRICQTTKHCHRSTHALNCQRVKILDSIPTPWPSFLKRKKKQVCDKMKLASFEWRDHDDKSIGGADFTTKKEGFFSSPGEFPPSPHPEGGDYRTPPEGKPITESLAVWIFHKEWQFKNWTGKKSKKTFHLMTYLKSKSQLSSVKFSLLKIKYFLIGSNDNMYGWNLHGFNVGNKYQKKIPTFPEHQYNLIRFAWIILILNVWLRLDTGLALGWGLNVGAG